MAVDWIAVMKRGDDFTEEMSFRDIAWTTAVRATAELEGDFEALLPLSVEETRLLTIIRSMGYAIAEGNSEHLPFLRQEIRKYVYMLGHIRQHKENR